MSDNIYRELLEFRNYGASTVSVLPPTVGIKVRMPDQANYHLCRVAFHGTFKYALKTAGMVPISHH
jgi:hypothetical protein